MFIRLKLKEKTRITVTRRGGGAFSGLHVHVQCYRKNGIPYDKSYIDYGDDDFKLIIEVPEPK